ncbi:MAG: protein TolR [Sphingomonadaceae bacterium]|nr:protein TolR [Sphingomonadaceae bacterium]
MAMTGPPSGGRGHRRAPMAEINVTPLVDVMLVLLIIFMITAPLLVTGVKIDLPDSRAAALDQKEKPIVVSIDGSGAVFIDEAPVPQGELAGRLAGIAATRGREDQAPQLFLRADKSLDYGRVMAVMGELNHAGLNKVALVSQAGDARGDRAGGRDDQGE